MVRVMVRVGLGWGCFWLLASGAASGGGSGWDFEVGFWVGLRAWDFPTERVLPWTPLIIRSVDQKVVLESAGQRSRTWMAHLLL